MTNFSLIQKYVELQTDIMFDIVTDLDYAILTHSTEDKSHYWNYALVNEVLSPLQMSGVEQRMNQSQRPPAFYFENTDKLSDLAIALKQRGYKQAGEVSWMFYTSAPIDESKFGMVKKVENTGDLEVYLQTFNLCYQKNDPTNPYGELGEYLEAARQTWIKHHASSRVEYFLVYNGSSAVAVSALTNYQGIGYISNVGSLMSVRGQGYGKLATMYAVKQSLLQNNKTTFLLTEDGTNPNRFYTALGFETKFTARLMLKQ